MKSSSATLLDLLTSKQFRVVTLLTLGLYISQIAELLESNEEDVYHLLDESLKQAGCPNTTALALRLLNEVEQDRYGERLKEELAELQKAAKRMLEKVEPACRWGTKRERGDIPPSKWVM